MLEVSTAAAAVLVTDEITMARYKNSADLSFLLNVTGLHGDTYVTALSSFTQITLEDI